jgi:hypothetical protein
MVKENKMRKIILAMALVLFMVPSIWAADVTISITIPSAYVSRLAAAVGSLNCTVVDENGDVVETLNAQACLKRKILNELGDFVNKYEENLAIQSAKDAYNTTMQEWLDNYVPIPVE